MTSDPSSKLIVLSGIYALNGKSWKKINYYTPETIPGYKYYLGARSNPIKVSRTDVRRLLEFKRRIENFPFS